jgi:hypothetical protein
MSQLGGHHGVRQFFVLLAMVASAHLIDGAQTLARANDDDRGLRAVPVVFVGTAPECAPSPPGSNIVTSAWLRGMGLPDNGSSNVTSLNPANRDPHRGLLLSKNGETTDCSSALARILGVVGMLVTADFHLGFDYRNGGHCGAGAPRFNVEYRRPDGTDGFSFVGGCANDKTPTSAPQDPAQWTRVRFMTSDPTESFPIIPPGSRIRRITLIVDEGTDSDSLQDPQGVGLSVVDNIDINGRLITRGTGVAPDRDDDDGRREDEDGDWHSMDVQGGQAADAPMAADANSLAVGGALDDGQLLVLEIYNPAGLLVGTSVPAAGRVFLSVPVALAGTYTIRVRNIGLTPVSTTITLIRTVLR